MDRHHDRQRNEKQMIKLTTVLLALLLPAARSAEGQVLIRVGDPGRATYSELHEALRPGTRAADSALAVLREKRPSVLWRRVGAALRGDVAWPPGQDPIDLLAPLRAVELERRRAERGDGEVLKEILAMIPSGSYGVGDAWVLGRLGRASSDSVRARFLAADGAELKVRYLTLLSFSADTGAIPLLARIYAAPDSFGIPQRYGSRASDALLWIGTRSSLAALLDARRRARARGVYAAPELSRGGYDFLADDSSAVISRTGKWLTEWIEELPVTSSRAQRGTYSTGFR
jgi:hypothetical protein